jgi:hypothetical protein
MAGAPTTRSVRDSGIGRSPVGGWWVVVLTVLFAAAALGLLAALFSFWPGSYEGAPVAPPPTVAVFLGREFTLDRDHALMLMVGLAGATGSLGHVLRSFFRYVGERNLVWSWVPSYLLTPFVGALLATITYVVVRAGFIGVSGASLGNPFGFAAIALLVGLFSGQAAQKLKEVFETIFTRVPSGSEAVEVEGAAGVSTDTVGGVGATATAGDTAGTQASADTEIGEIAATSTELGPAEIDEVATASSGNAPAEAERDDDDTATVAAVASTGVTGVELAAADAEPSGADDDDAADDDETDAVAYVTVRQAEAVEAGDVDDADSAVGPGPGGEVAGGASPGGATPGGPGAAAAGGPLAAPGAAVDAGGQR